MSEIQAQSLEYFHNLPGPAIKFQCTLLHVIFATCLFHDFAKILYFEPR